MRKSPELRGGCESPEAVLLTFNPLLRLMVQDQLQPAATIGVPVLHAARLGPGRPLPTGELEPRVKA